MPYVLTIATPETRDLVVDSLRRAADQRTRVARQAAGKVAADKRTGRDVRSAAVRVTALLAEADELVDVAEQLAALEELAIVTTAPTLTAVPIPEPGVDLTPLEDPTPLDVAAMAVGQTDDGTSPEAQALAAAAGLEDAIVEDGVDTGAIAEDEAGEPEEVLP